MVLMQNSFYGEKKYARLSYLIMLPINDSAVSKVFFGDKLPKCTTKFFITILISTSQLIEKAIKATTFENEQHLFCFCSVYY